MQLVDLILISSQQLMRILTKGFFVLALKLNLEQSRAKENHTKNLFANWPSLSNILPSEVQRTLVN